MRFNPDPCRELISREGVTGMAEEDSCVYFRWDRGRYNAHAISRVRDIGYIEGVGGIAYE